jgi:hypothetical protein
MQYITRAGKPASLIGYGPLSKTFKLFQVDDKQYLVWAHSLRYRMDFDSKGNPVLDTRDIVEQ